MNNGFNFNMPFNNPFVKGMPSNMMPIYPGAKAGSLLGGVHSGIGASSKITFSGILNGASKTLGVINQAIPVFYQIKPIFNNARTMLKVVKGINSKDDHSSSNNNISSNSENFSSIKKEKQVNAPTFFA